MEIVSIYPPFLYSVQYDGDDLNVLFRLISTWKDIEAVKAFMDENKELLAHKIWKRITAYNAALQVLDEANGMDDMLRERAERAERGMRPDLDDLFQYLDGIYKYELQYPPMKLYGTGHPPMLRLYAIKMCANTYLIVDGGIKLARTIQASPDIRTHVLQNVDLVRKWLKQNGIYDSDDMK